MTRLGVVVWLILGLGLATGIGACHSDTQASASTAQEAPAVADVGDSAANSDKKLEEEAARLKPGLDKVKAYKAEFTQFYKNVLALREVVKKIPAASKKNAAGFAKLEEMLANYPEKGSSMIEEITGVINQVEAHLNPDTAISQGQSPDQVAVLDVDLDERAKVYEATASAFRIKYAELEKAVEKLKTANGAPVVLFE